MFLSESARVNVRQSERQRSNLSRKICLNINAKLYKGRFTGDGIKSIHLRKMTYLHIGQFAQIRCQEAG